MKVKRFTLFKKSNFEGPTRRSGECVRRNEKRISWVIAPMVAGISRRGAVNHTKIKTPPIKMVSSLLGLEIYSRFGRFVPD
jgi:hypothetical protein